MISLADRLNQIEGHPSGFDFLRLFLAVSVLAFHSFTIDLGDTVFWQIVKENTYTIPHFNKLVFSAGTPIAFIVPSFFALSGFLVGGSLERNSLPSFLALRAMRIFPALSVEVIVSALILGSLLTTMPLSEYFLNQQFWYYFRNILGDIHYELPGVLADQPPPNYLNAQLWTVPYELDCYLALAAAAAVGIVGLRNLFSFIVLCGVIAATFLQLRQSVPIGSHLVLAFLAGVALYLNRQRVSFSGPLAITSLLLCWLCLQHTKLLFISSIPVAYLTVWLGLQNPPRTRLVEGADYSYGIYLYSYPVQQTLAHFFPPLRQWHLNLTVGLVCSLAVAYLSWHLVELPILRRKRFVVDAIDRQRLSVLARFGFNR